MVSYGKNAKHNKEIVSTFFIIKLRILVSIPNVISRLEELYKNEYIKMNYTSVLIYAYLIILNFTLVI